MLSFLLHLIPIWFFYENVKPTNKRWDEIHEKRVQARDYEDWKTSTTYVEADSGTRTSQQSRRPAIGSEEPENLQNLRKIGTPERIAKKSKRIADDNDD